MTLHRFKALSHAKQRWWILERSNYISQRQTEDFTVFLFQLASFYIEVFFHNDNEEVLQIKSFGSTDGLDPYLEEISLYQLFKI